MILYKVESAYGSWDETWYETNGIFSTKEKAEKVKQTIKNKIKYIKNLKNKIDLNELIEKDLEKYDFYSELFHLQSEYNWTKIYKIELDKIELFELEKIGTREEKIKRLLNG